VSAVDGVVSQSAASDESLMLRYQRGDRKAFAELVKRYEVKVYNFVLRQVGSALAADELARQVFFGVVVEASRFNYETPFSTRLFEIACQVCHRQRRDLPRPRVESRQFESGLSAESSPLEGETLEEALERAVQELPNDEKDVFLLREVAEIPFADIAQITRQTRDGVKVRMQHALARLRVALQSFEEYRRALRS
jgi:RNA polymerase sigma-70 factor (ECF subfamily)